MSNLKYCISKVVFILFICFKGLIFAIETPHQTFQCVVCHITGKISTVNGGIELSIICLECHKPGGYAKPVNVAPVNPYGKADIIIERGKGTEHAFFGKDINDKAKAVRPSGDEFYGQQVTGAITCATCHNPHVQNLEEGKFLRVKLGKNDELCLRCHAEMNQGKGGYSHPVNIPLENRDDLFSFPQFSSLKKVYEAKENKVICTVCHKVHNGFSKITTTGYLGDGYLGRVNMDEWLCLQCHKKPVHGNSKDSADKLCKDCHSLHNPGNNIKLVKNKFHINNKMVDVTFSKDNTPGDFYNSEGNGICQVCHKNTKYFRNYSVQKYIVTGNNLHNPNNLSCLECHSHGVVKDFIAPKAKEKPTFEKDAFKGCSGCHGYPPVLPSLGQGGLVKNEGGTGSTSTGAHSKHATSEGYAYSCDTCHKGGMPASPIYDKKIQIGFELLNGLIKGGVFETRSSIKNGYSFTSGNGETTVISGSSTRCSNIYCHSNAIPFDKSAEYKTVDWQDSNLTCTNCHAGQSQPGLLSGKHAAHIQSSYSYVCEDCHNETVTGTNQIKNKTKHVDGEKNVSFKNGGNYGADRSCSNYCHSNGNNGQVETPVKWSDNISMTCDSCHRGRINDFKNMTSAGHNRLASKNWIRQYPCYYCHDDTVDENGNIKNYSKHINKIKDVKISSKWAIP